MLEIGNYRIANPDALMTPTMVVFDDRVEHNIRSACELAGGAANLCVHVKTHKSAAITQKLLEAGIDAFKVATLRELEMVLRAGARRAILACPQTQVLKLEKLAELILAFPQAAIATIAAAEAHVEMLGRAATALDDPLPVLLDLDPGMHRTGVEIGDAGFDLYRSIDRHPSLSAAGLHCYDGHDTFSDPGERAAAAGRHADALAAFRRRLETEGLPVPKIVAGGAYSFSYYARRDGMQGSPGSFIYWDARCRSDMPDTPFENAAVILAQVVDKSDARRTITTDLGYKSISADQPLAQRAVLEGYEDAKLVLHNEEYGVFRMPGPLPPIGSYLLAVPWHIGPTTIRYPGCYVIDAAGEVAEYREHTARDRL